MLVSVYIPTRNRRVLVERAIRSVLEQDHADFEVLVVDDASTDDTRSFLAAMAASDPRLVAFSNDRPLGAPAARNRAISAAKGEFITGLDDDDYFEPTRLRRFLAAWKEFESEGKKPSCIYAQSVSMRGGRAIWVSQRPGSVEHADLFTQNVIGNQVFAPREHFFGAGLFDEQLPAWQDLDLFIRMLLRYGTAYLVPVPTY
jgi:glycosyltransferase involved in cell wall biosynthesis